MKKTSRVVTKCGSCESSALTPVLFLGYLPPVNKMTSVGAPLEEQPGYPAELLRCSRCSLVQIGCIVDKEVLFPSDYPYTSSTTKNLRENFAALAVEVKQLMKLDEKDLVVDVGSNDGNLLTNFVGTCRVLGVTPEDVGRTAEAKGVNTIIDYFGSEVAKVVVRGHGRAKVVTCTNCFAHVDDVDDFVAGIKEVLTPEGIFITESHYLPALIEDLQYDTIYHEHLRYYSLRSLGKLLEDRGFFVFDAKEIETHGGSIRVFASLTPKERSLELEELLEEEDEVLSPANWKRFKQATVQSKILMHSLIVDLIDSARSHDEIPVKIFGVGAPSRATTLVNYMGLDDVVIDAVVEVAGSRKIGSYMPGTKIPIISEDALFDFNDQPDYALLLSWHIADELIPKLRAKGYHGKFIVPLPIPKVIDSLEELHDVDVLPV